MSEEISLVETTQTHYENYASSYQTKKRNTMINLLECGKILYEVVESLGYGVWCQFLKDVRVSESERTAHRILSIFKNYRHLLDENYQQKADALSSLGVSHLLELQKLPDRFKKDIEIIREHDGEEKKEIVQVIDEEKLGDFLEQQVTFEGEQKHIRDLPVSEMKKYIKEAKGIYEPESYFEDLPTLENNNKESVPPKLNSYEETTPTTYKDKISDKIELILSTSNELFKEFNHVDLVFIDSLSEDDKQNYINLVGLLNSACEGLIIKSTEFKDKIN